MLSRLAGRRPHLEVRRGAVILVDSSPTEKPVGATCTHKHIRTHWSSRGVAVLTSHAQLPTNGKYAWSTNYSASDPPMRRTADHKQTAHMRRRVPRSRTHQTKRSTAPRHPVRRATSHTIAAPQAASRATGVTLRVQRPLVVEVQPFKGLADLTLLSYARPSSRPQIDQRTAHRRGGPCSAAHPLCSD